MDQTWSEQEPSWSQHQPCSLQSLLGQASPFLADTSHWVPETSWGLSIKYGPRMVLMLLQLPGFDVLSWVRSQHLALVEEDPKPWVFSPVREAPQMGSWSDSRAAGCVHLSVWRLVGASLFSSSGGGAAGTEPS